MKCISRAYKSIQKGDMKMNANELIGKQFFHDWKAESIIGSGSYGTVYRMTSNRLGETTYAAMKWIGIPQQKSDVEKNRSRGATEKQLRTFYTEQKDRLVREIRVMDKFHGHSNIIDMLNFETHERENGMGWDVFILMELLDGLESCLPGMTVQDIRRLGLNLCAALTACEHEHIIHRDIKPENIFRNRFGEYKLGDFGIARPMSGSASHLTVNQGTPLYMAPEVRFGKEYDHRADIYSLGMVLYRLLNQQCIPFLKPENSWSIEAEDEAYERRLKGEDLPVPVQLANRPEFAKVVLKACAFRPEDRYKNAQEMTAALQAIPKSELSDERLWLPASGNGKTATQVSDMTVNPSGLNTTPRVEEAVPVYEQPTVRQIQTGSLGKNETVSVWDEQPPVQKKQDSRNATVSVWDDIHEQAQNSPDLNATVSIWDRSGADQKAGEKPSPKPSPAPVPKQETKKEPEVPAPLKEEPAPETAVTKKNVSAKWFIVLSAVYAVLACIDSEAVWYTISYGVGLARNLRDFFLGTMHGIPFIVLFGGLGLLSLWMTSKEKRKAASVLAGANTVLSLAAVYGMYSRYPAVAAAWILYAAASVLLLMYTLKHERGAALGWICIGLGIASLAVTLVLTFFEPKMSGGLIASGSYWWMVKNWFQAIFAGGWLFVRSTRGAAPASVLMPFSRGILLIAFGLGIRFVFGKEAGK